MILCCGEALIDMIPETTLSGAQGFVPHAGGSVFNTAIALGRLGAPTGMVTGLSSDLFGQQLSAALAASGVDTATVITSDRPTTLALVELTDGHATYHFYDENTAGRMIRPEEMPPVASDVDALYFGGISLAVEPCADTYAAFLETEGAGRAVMLDPNIRPGFIRDEARFRARLTGMIARADIVKVSDEDLGWLTGGTGDLAAQAAQVLAEGPAIVIVTRGGEGATAYLAGGGEVSVPARKAVVVDTVGAGDTFNAGVLAHLSEAGALSKEALRAPDAEVIRAALDLGARVAAVTVSRAGANPPRRDEL